MEVTLVGASWVVVAGDQTGCGLHSFEVLWSTEVLVEKRETEERGTKRKGGREGQLMRRAGLRHDDDDDDDDYF